MHDRDVIILAMSIYCLLQIWWSSPYYESSLLLIYLLNLNCTYLAFHCSVYLFYKGTVYCIALRWILEFDHTLHIIIIHFLYPLTLFICMKFVYFTLYWSLPQACICILYVNSSCTPCIIPLPFLPFRYQMGTLCAFQS